MVKLAILLFSKYKTKLYPSLEKLLNSREHILGLNISDGSISFVTFSRVYEVNVKSGWTGKIMWSLGT